MTDMSVQTTDPTRSRARARGRRRGAAFYVGLALVLAGLGLLGYVGWQMYGTNIVSKRAHERVVNDLRGQWETDGQATAPEVVLDSDLGPASALVRIPRFGEDYVVPVLEGVGDDELASGYGHFPRSARPGRVGNYALAGHRVTHGEPLRDMPKLRPGDEVVIETRDAVYTYRLDTNPNDLVVTFRDVWVVDPLPTNPTPDGVQPSQAPGQKLITLTTCAELFHTDDRMIAFGHLVDTERKGAR
jgi:sortase A